MFSTIVYNGVIAPVENKANIMEFEFSYRGLKALVVHVSLRDNTLQGFSVVLVLKPVRVCVYNSYKIYDPGLYRLVT